MAGTLTIALALLAVLPASGAAERATSPAADRAAAHAFVQRVLRAYGGAEALERVRAYRLEGSVFSAMRHSDAPTVRIWQRPDRFKALLDYDWGAEARVAVAGDVWRNPPGEALQRTEGAMRAAVLLQATRAGVPWILADRESLLRVDGDQPLPEGASGADGGRRHLLAASIRGAEGMVFRLWIDADGRVVATQGLVDFGGTRTRFETYYSDFRDVDGVRFAFHEDNWASGMQTGITSVQRIILNPPLRPDEFEPPSEGGTRKD